MVVEHVAEMLAAKFPRLKYKLRMARIATTPTEFVKKVLISSTMLSIGVLIFLYILFNAFNINELYLILLAPITWIAMFLYMMLYPDAKIIQRRWEIDKDVVFAARHILISVKSGLPLYDALLGASQGYGEVSNELRTVMERVAVGVPLNHAIRQAAEDTPSDSLKRVLLQISNALSSGADVGTALDAITEQIASEQLTALKAYGQKLNPYIMFFLMFGVIFPSIGMAFAIILISMISGGQFNLNKALLLGVACVIALVQYLFVNAIESSRPKYDV